MKPKHTFQVRNIIRLDWPIPQDTEWIGLPHDSIPETEGRETEITGCYACRYCGMEDEQHEIFCWTKAWWTKPTYAVLGHCGFYSPEYNWLGVEKGRQGNLFKVVDKSGKQFIVVASVPKVCCHKLWLVLLEEWLEKYDNKW